MRLKTVLKALKRFRPGGPGEKEKREPHPGQYQE